MTFETSLAVEFALRKKVPAHRSYPRPGLTSRRTRFRMSRARRELGQRGERAALAYLQERGYILLHKNFRRQDGEIDLILRDGETLVFCEVKTQRSVEAAESYSPRQQARMRRLVLSYLARSGWEGPVRVDLMALDEESGDERFRIHHFHDILSDDT